MQPDKIVIYDAFVERSVVVLQCLDEALASKPRINTPPKAAKDEGSELMAAYYMNYQDLVKIIYAKQKKLITNLKLAHDIEYEYDLRIMDKLLWMMGGFKEAFKLGAIDCKK